MKRSIIYTILFTLLLLTTVVEAQYHGNGDLVDKLRSELEKTDQFIEQAKEAVRQSKSVKAKVALDMAITLQDNAWGKFRHGQNSSYIEAGILTQEAREKAKYAIANGQFNEQNDDAVLRKLEQTESLLRHLNDKVMNRENQQIKQLVETVNNNLKRAWEFYRDGNLRPAYKLCNQIQNTLRRLKQQVGNFQSNYDRSYQHVLNQFELYRAGNESCESENAATFAGQAEQALKRSEEFKSQKRYQAAVTALQSSNNLINKALRLCYGEQNIEGKLRQLQNEADRLKELIPAADENISSLMTQLDRHLELAASFVKDGDLKSATAATRASQMLLDQIVELLNSN